MQLNQSGSDNKIKVPKTQQSWLVRVWWAVKNRGWLTSCQLIWSSRKLASGENLAFCKFSSKNDMPWQNWCGQQGATDKLSIESGFPLNLQLEKILPFCRFSSMNDMKWQNWCNQLCHFVSFLSLVNSRLRPQMKGTKDKRLTWEHNHCLLVWKEKSWRATKGHNWKKFLLNRTINSSVQDTSWNSHCKKMQDHMMKWIMGAIFVSVMMFTLHKGEQWHDDIVWGLIIICTILQF